MKLGSPLATIRYNDEYAGVKKVFEPLGITPGHLANIRVAQGFESGQEVCEKPKARETG